MTEENDSSTVQGSEVEEILHNKEFGSPLRDAREKAGLSITDVAQSLLIPEDIISAIENSQMDKLPSATFVIGYIRGYARLLNVSADDVIALYNSMLPAAEGQMSPSAFVPDEQKDTNNKTAFVMLVSIVLLLLIAWWFQLDTVTIPEKPYQQDDVSNFTDSNDASYDEESAVTDSAELLVEPLIDSNAEIVENIPATEEIPSEISDNSTIQTDELMLTAIGESWCEVFDATGKRLFYQLMNEDEEVKLYGQAPFKVFLGNASQIRIETNKKIVDFEHLIVGNKNIANFTISADAEVDSDSNR